MFLHNLPRQKDYKKPGLGCQTERPCPPARLQGENRHPAAPTLKPPSAFHVFSSLRSARGGDFFYPRFAPSSADTWPQKVSFVKLMNRHERMDQANMRLNPAWKAST